MLCGTFPRRNIICKWYQPDLVEHWIEGLRKAGLEIPEVKKEDQK
jgi:hypothetical protein